MERTELPGETESAAAEVVTVTELRGLGGGKFTLGLDSGETLRVSLEQVADFSLFAGRELTAEELSELRSALALAGAKERAMRVISARGMSERELYDRLLEKGENERNAAAAVAWLIDLHFLDDAEYAAGIVRRCAARGFGPRRVREELYRHKIPKELWDAALCELPEQDDTLDRLLDSRLRGTEPGDRRAVKRAVDALLRRGFGWEEIREALERRREETD